jgi:uncharacterized protein
LIAYLKSQDNFHSWAVAQWQLIEPPFLTCEAVIVEACFLLRNTYNGAVRVFALMEADIIKIPFCLEEESKAVAELMSRYESVPMSLADGCLVRMSELYANSEILTLDSDFTIYRQHRNVVIPVILP